MQTVTPSAGTVTIDQKRDNIFLVPLAANVTAVQLINGDQKKGQYIEVHFVQDTTGSRTVTGWPASVKLAGSGITLTTTGGKRDVLALRQVANASDASGVKYTEVSRSMNNAG